MQKSWATQSRLFIYAMCSELLSLRKRNRLPSLSKGIDGKDGRITWRSLLNAFEVHRVPPSQAALSRGLEPLVPSSRPSTSGQP